MCELMALCFARPVAAAFSIHAFALRDEENADGWGLAWYADRSLTIVKEPISWRKSQYASFLETYDHLLSHIYIAHVRHATVGGAPTHADTHPFSRELKGRAYCFAHNGTVRSAFASLALGHYQPMGKTDSEHILCHLLNELVVRPGLLSTESDWRWLARRFASINRMGKFNCLLSDGERVFAWHDADGFKGLHFRGVRMDGARVEHLQDPTMDIDLESGSEPEGWPSQAITKTNGGKWNRGTVIATRPLTGKGWHAFQKGELLVLQDGRIVYSNVRSRQPRTENHAITWASPAVTK
jgi:predicted glutamine amidotransferase